MGSQRRIAGVLLVVAAVAAVLLPFASGTLLTIGLGGIAFAAGVGQFLRLGSEAGGQARLFRVLTGLLYCGAALWVLIDPIDSEISLTLFVGVLLLVEGVMELAAGATTAGPAAGLTVLDGVVTAILGLLLVLEWPSDSLWALGTLFGVGLFLSSLNHFQAPTPPSEQA